MNDASAVQVDSWPRYSVRSVLRWILERELTPADLDADCRPLTIAQAAKLLGCSRATAYRLLGKPSPPITPTRVGEELRFPPQRVLALTHATPWTQARRQPSPHSRRELEIATPVTATER